MEQMDKLLSPMMTASEQQIQDYIYTIRDIQVMVDKDLAVLYGVETKHINQAIKNNQDKFQEDFFFELTDAEFTVLRSKDLTTNFSKTRTNPKVFTEQGIYMLANFLKTLVKNGLHFYLFKWMYLKLRRKLGRCWMHNSYKYCLSHQFIEERNKGCMYHLVPSSLKKL